MSEPGGRPPLGGRYAWGTLIGRGGMGEVWQARDTLLDRDVAVKKLAYPPEVDQTGSVNRTMREARLAARLNHPNAVAIYDVVLEDGMPYLVMELVRGKALNTLISERVRLDPMHAARIGRQVAAALAAAHRSGIIHRDVKPANVLITQDGTAKLTDFGIAHDETELGLTSTGQFIGTPNYLAPEIALGNEHRAPSDVWALGTVLYNAVEGAPPYGVDGNALAVLNRVATSDPLYPGNAGPLLPVINATMRRDPQERPDAATVERMLVDVLDGRPPQLPPSGPRPAPPMDLVKTGTKPTAVLPPVSPMIPPGHSPGPGYAPTPPAPPMYPAYGPPSGPLPQRRSKTPLIVVGLLTAMAVAAAIGVLAARNDAPAASPTTSTSAPTTPETTPTTPESTDETTPENTETTEPDPHEACTSDREDAVELAISYGLAVGLKLIDAAKACTDGNVDDETQQLSGKVLLPDLADPGSSGDDEEEITMSAGDTTVVLTCTKQEDGKYLITAVDIQE